MAFQICPDSNLPARCPLSHLLRKCQLSQRESREGGADCTPDESGYLLRRPARVLLLPSRLAPCRLPQRGRRRSARTVIKQRKSPKAEYLRAFLVSLRGVEPPACRLGGGRSIQLSYRDIHIYRVNAIYSIYDCRTNCKQMPPSAFGLFRICLQEGIALRRKKHYDNEMNQTAAVWSLCTSEEAPRCSQKKSKA